MGVVDFLYDTGRQITGNIPKALLCVPNYKLFEGRSEQEVIGFSDNIRKSLTAAVTGTGSRVVQTYGSITGDWMENAVRRNRYNCMEVQYNPSTIYMETVAGSQMDYRSPNLGDAGSNMLQQNVEPAATILSVELLFDQVNAQDSFMVTNLSPNIGNLVTAGMNLAKGSYSVKPQMDGIMALLTRPLTRHVIFFWSKMCFQGELTNVNAKYTMFNTSGNPVRGTISLNIRQSDDPDATYENTYWEQAFTKVFGESTAAASLQGKSTASKILSNSVLNLNI